MALEGYQDIDKYVGNYNQMLDQQLQTMNDLTDKDVQLQTERLARQKEDIDRETVQQNRAIYQDYRKNSNPFGVQAENLASQGLGNSGYAETTQSRLYNTYQNNITATLNTARQLKSDVDFAINEAIKTGDITKGQNAIRVFEQRMQLLSEEFDLRNNREQLLYNRQYQRDRDAIDDKRWQTQFDYTKSRDKEEDKWRKKQWDYQIKQDKNEEKWRQKEWDYNTSKKAKASSRRGSGGNKNPKNDNGSDGNEIYTGDEAKNSNNKNANSKSLLGLIMKGANSILKQTTIGKVTKATKEGLKMGARQYIYRAVENNLIDDKEADALYKKLGLEK